MTEEKAKHFRKLLHEKQHGNSLHYFSWGRDERMSIPTEQSKDSIHVHLGELMHLWGLLTGRWMRSYWQSLDDPKTAPSPPGPAHHVWWAHGSCLIESFSVKPHFQCSAASPTILMGAGGRTGWNPRSCALPFFLLGSVNSSIIVTTDFAVTLLVSFFHGPDDWLMLSLLHDGQGYARKKEKKNYKQTLTFIVLYD